MAKYGAKFGGSCRPEEEENVGSRNIPFHKRCHPWHTSCNLLQRSRKGSFLELQWWTVMELNENGDHLEGLSLPFVSHGIPRLIKANGLDEEALGANSRTIHPWLQGRGCELERRPRYLSGPIRFVDKDGIPAKQGDLLAVKICNLGPLPGDE
ncbi:hypothetical protein QQP08_003558 [Theobroma cacao]|nr:hypothetical protein QQP08_003558 [Theobroma cacao]